MWQYNYSDDYLAHYGVLGMKWGVRKGNRGQRTTLSERIGQKKIEKAEKYRPMMASEKTVLTLQNED